MAFIKNTEREKLIKNVNRSYAVKKLLLLIDIVALVAWVVLVFVSFYKEGNGDTNWSWFQGSDVTGLGIGMIIYAVAVVALGIVCVVLVFTIRSPKAIKKDIKTLESSAISGKKINKNLTAGEIMRERRTPEKAKKNKKK